MAVERQIISKQIKCKILAESEAIDSNATLEDIVTDLYLGRPPDTLIKRLVPI